MSAFPVDSEQAAANAAATLLLERLASSMDVPFPMHAMALRGEVVGRRLTTDRWNRIAAVLASLHAVPGAFLTPAQHDVRNAALAAIVVAQKMAAAGFAWRNPGGSREFAVWLADGIRGRLEKA